MTKNKDLSIELMRIIATFFVIFNHTREMGFFLFPHYPTDTYQYWLYLFLSIFCKFAVPLFFMISGALYLNREQESFLKLSKRITRFLFVLLFWSVFYYIKAYGISAFSLRLFIRKIYESESYTLLWFLYCYLAFLIVLPLLQRIAKSLSDKDYLYLIGIIVVIYMIIPAAEYLFWQGRHSLNPNLKLDWLTHLTFLYPLIGYFIYHRAFTYLNKKRFIFLWLINIFTIILSAYLTYYRSKYMGVCDEGCCQEFHNTFVLINASTIFLSCHYFAKHFLLGDKLKKIILSISANTFGIYLLHSYLTDMTPLAYYEDHLFNYKMQLPMFSTLVFCLIIFIIANIITFILKKIPLISKIVS